MNFRAIGTALAAVLLVPAHAQAQAQNQQRPAQPRAAPAQQAQPARQAQPTGPQVPPAQAQLLLIRSTMLAFDQANKTNVYHVLHGLGSDQFRTANSPDSMAKNFAQFRSGNVDLSPVAILAPRLSQQPAIQQGRLHLVGFFPTNPMQINFDLWFEPSQNRWKMAQLQVGLSRAPQQAQQPQQGQQRPQPQAQPQPQQRQPGR